MTGVEPPALAAAILQGDRRALSRGITLVESSRAADQESALALVEALLPHSGKALRLGISGPPGVGKSTLIDALGVHESALGRRVAVLAVDPSSQKTGGSILGDKTRMARLGAIEDSFIRPSPSRGTRGGLAPRTREAMSLCEAAGYDLVIVETVGVGQGEVDIAALVDCLLVLVAPGSGDELQGMKRGILEHADLVLVTKADGAERERAERAAAELTSALGLFADGACPVLVVSALEERNLDRLQREIGAFVQRAKAAHTFQRRRQEQDLSWFRRSVEQGLRERLFARAALDTLEQDLAQGVREGRLSPRGAARELLDALARALSSKDQ